MSSKKRKIFPEQSHEMISSPAKIAKTSVSPNAKAARTNGHAEHDSAGLIETLEDNIRDLRAQLAKSDEVNKKLLEYMHEGREDKGLGAKGFQGLPLLFHFSCFR